MQFTKAFFKRSLCLELIICLLFCLCGRSLAESSGRKKTTVKVAFYQLDGFFEYDENGEPCGYGVDYLNELKNYGNIEWEFVPTDSWEGIKAMMLDGRVDVRMPVSEPSKPSELYDYTVEPMLMSYHAIMTLKTRTDLYYQDYETIGTLKIAVVDNLLDKTGVGDYLTAIGVIGRLVDYPDYNSCLAALESGEADALISNVMDLTDELKVLDKFEVVDNYITTLKSNPCYPVINNAMTKMRLEKPFFQSELYIKYYPDRANEPFTKEESQFIAETPFLTVAVYPNRKPVSYQDRDGCFCGIAVDLANLVSEKIGIPFQYVPVTADQPTDMLDQADLVMPVLSSIDTKLFFVSRSLLDSKVIMAVPDNTSDLPAGAKVGVLRDTPGIRKTIEDLGCYDVKQYDTNRDAFNALQRGGIDAFANSSYVINWMLQNPRYSDLTTLLYQSFPLSFSICGKAENTVLSSLVEKAIQMIPDDQRDDIVLNGTKLTMDDFTSADRLYTYRWQLLFIMLALLLIVGLIVAHGKSRNNYIRLMEENAQKLESANHAKSDFLSRMSHDMRTPMNGILGLTSLLRGRTDPQEIEADVNQIELSGKYLLSLINDTLDMSKIESGKMELHPEPISSEALFSNVIATSAILAKQKGVELKLELPPIEHGQWVPVVADAHRVEQIFINIISNAIKFTPKGGTVTLHMETVGITEETVSDRYIISDTGIGMSEAFQQHLFEPFSQEGKANTSGDMGTGLGLAIVKMLVDMMGGSITVSSKEGQGTTFTVELQYPHYHGELAAPNTAAADRSRLAGKRILLCEDHPVNAQIATRLLEKQNMLVDRAENGQIGVEKFKQSPEHTYDAILMDIRMPVLNGIEAAKAIRAMKDRADAATVPILAMTANAFDDDRAETKAAGMNAHLAKPIEPDRLYDALAAAME